METPGLDRQAWLERLALIDQGLQRQGARARLTLVGSVAGILAGQPGRTSLDLDVWKPTSRYPLGALRRAVEAAGLLYDPKSVLEPDTPYLQVIEPGLVQTGAFAHPEPLECFGALRLERPPIAHLIASKLLRAEARDLEDIAFLLASYRPDRRAIVRAVRTMRLPARANALENLVYLEAMSGGI